MRVHDLKHTYGRRLRNAGVNFEDRQDLLGHTSGRITTHYSPSEITKLIEAANKACVRADSSPTLDFVKSHAQIKSRKNPASSFVDFGKLI